MFGHILLRSKTCLILALLPSDTRVSMLIAECILIMAPWRKGVLNGRLLLEAAVNGYFLHTDESGDQLYAVLIG